MMLFVTLAWWYTAGWADLVKKSGRRIDRILEAFSVSLLLGSLFEPFRQLSTEHAGGGLDSQLRAMGDRLFSRVFGAAIRGLFILIGCLSAVGLTVWAVIEIIAWPFLPVLPVAGAIITLLGWRL